jgi:hypothetical protein
MFLRRACEVLAAQNRRDEAQAVCWEALQAAHSPAAIGATVRALVSGPTAPSFDEVNQALTLLTVEHKRFGVTNPILARAMCDVAESIGDGIMLHRCTEELERLAPDYPATRRARAALDTRCPPWRFWLGWLTIAGAVIATAADALRQLLRRRAPRTTGRTVVVATMAVGLFTFAGTARADLPPAPPGAMMSIWPVDDHDPEAHIPSEKDRAANPLQMGYWIQDVIEKAELASKIGDHQAAVKYYRALYKAAPNRALPLTRLCTEYEKLGDINAAVNTCGMALLMDGLTINDYAHFVRLVLEKPGNPTTKDVQAMMNVIGHLRDSNGGAAAAFELECEVGLRISDVDKLRECTTGLTKTSPGDPKTIYYQWALAMREGRYSKARDLLAQAKAAGTSGESLKNMEVAVDEGSRRQRWWLFSAAGCVLFLGALGYGILVMTRRMLARRRSEPAPA